MDEKESLNQYSEIQRVSSIFRELTLHVFAFEECAAVKLRLVEQACTIVRHDARGWRTQGACSSLPLVIPVRSACRHMIV